MGSALSFCSVEERPPKIPPNLNCSPALPALLYMKQPPKRGDLQELRLLHPNKMPWDLSHPRADPKCHGTLLTCQGIGLARGDA